VKYALVNKMILEMRSCETLTIKTRKDTLTIFISDKDKILIEREE